jgi:hypothetical protein
LESYVLWIDEERKQETLKAMRKKQSFPEVQRVIDVFKDGIKLKESPPAPELDDQEQQPLDTEVFDDEKGAQGE